MPMSEPEKSVLFKTVFENLENVYNAAQRYPELKKSAENFDANNKADFDQIHKSLEEYIRNIENSVAVARRSLAAVSNKLDDTLSESGSVSEDPLCVENGETVSADNSETANAETSEITNVEHIETVNSNTSESLIVKNSETVNIENSETLGDESCKSVNTKNSETVNVTNSETVNDEVVKTGNSESINVEGSDTIKDTSETESKDSEPKVGFLKLVNIEKLLDPNRAKNTDNNTNSDTIVLSDSDHESQDIVHVTKKPVSKAARKDFSQTNYNSKHNSKEFNRQLLKLGVQKQNLAINPFSKQNKSDKSIAESIREITANNSLSLYTKNTGRSIKVNSSSVSDKNSIVVNSSSVSDKNSDQTIVVNKSLSSQASTESTDKSFKSKNSSFSSDKDKSSSPINLPHSYDQKYYQKTYVPLTRVPAEQLLEDYKNNLSKKMERRSQRTRNERMAKRQKEESNSDSDAKAENKNAKKKVKVSKTVESKVDESKNNCDTSNRVSSPHSKEKNSKLKISENSSDEENKCNKDKSNKSKKTIEKSKELTSYKENTAKKNKKTKSSDSDVEMDTVVQNDTEEDTENDGKKQSDKERKGKKEKKNEEKSKQDEENESSQSKDKNEDSSNSESDDNLPKKRKIEKQKKEKQNNGKDSETEENAEQTPDKGNTAKKNKNSKTTDSDVEMEAGDSEKEEKKESVKEKRDDKEIANKKSKKKEGKSKLDEEKDENEDLSNGDVVDNSPKKIKMEKQKKEKQKNATDSESEGDTNDKKKEKNSKKQKEKNATDSESERDANDKKKQEKTSKKQKEKKKDSSDSDSDNSSKKRKQDREKSKKSTNSESEDDTKDKNKKKTEEKNKSNKETDKEKSSKKHKENSDESSNNDSDDTFSKFTKRRNIHKQVKAKLKNLWDSENEEDTDDKKKSKNRSSDNDETIEIDSDSEKSDKGKKNKDSSSDSGDDFATFNRKKQKEKASQKRKALLNSRSENDKGSEKSNNSSSSDDESDKKKKTTVRRRIKKVRNSSSEDGSESEKETAKEKNTRKQIRRLIDKSSLSQSTIEAEKEEKERKQRIAERQKKYNQIFEVDKLKKATVDKVVLDFDEDTNKELLKVDKHLVKVLKPHQAEGIRFMWDACFESITACKKRQSGCILAHCMGLGKTLQVITLSHTLLTNSEKTGVKKVLVVSPLSTVLNWVAEFKNWLPESAFDEYEVFELTTHKQNSVRQHMVSEWHKCGGVLVLGYDMYRNLSNDQNKRMPKKMRNAFQEALVDPGPDLVVCDEGHLLKNEKTSISIAMNKMKTLRRIVLTGTPLQNNLKEYFCMVQFVKPNLLGTYKEYLNRFVNPITNGQYTDSTPQDITLMRKRAHILHKLLDGIVQRKDYSVLEPYLPPKHEYVLFLNLTETQIKLYSHYLNNLARQAATDTKCRSSFLFADFQEFQRICTHPRVLLDKSIEVKEKMVSESESEGSLKDFIDDDDDEKSTSEGSSSGSESDSDKSAKNRKKGGRTRITRAKAALAGGIEKIVIDDEDEKDNSPKEWWEQFCEDGELDNIEVSGKLFLLFEILKQCELIGDKILVFSQSLYSLNIIEYFLDKIDQATQNGDSVNGFTGSWALGLDYFRLDGSSSCDNRAAWCKSFNNPDNPRARLFLISTRAGGLGINLVAANRVIIFDVSWNPSHDVQSIYRVYRFGQTKPCYIYRFVTLGTMEMKIYERQVVKQSISKRVIDEQQIDRHYAQNDIMELYKFEPKPDEERPIPLVPKDVLLGELLQNFPERVYKYHEHQTLLENREDEILNEEERKAAWEEFENEKTFRANTSIYGLPMAVASNALKSLLQKQHPDWNMQQILTAVPQMVAEMQKQIGENNMTMFTKVYQEAQYLKALDQQMRREQLMKQQALMMMQRYGAAANAFPWMNYMQQQTQNMPGASTRFPYPNFLPNQPQNSSEVIELNE